MKKKLPIGLQDFRSLIEDGFLYVDKTKQIFSLLESERYLFFSRPRRFGKSLLVSTLKEIFKGSRDLFKGLWIEDKIDWDSIPVIHLDFSLMVALGTRLEDGIEHELDFAASQHGIELKSKGYSLKFNELIRVLGKEKRVAILIDEYDKPIVDFLDDPDKADHNREVLRGFYAAIKGNASYIRFFFLTGVSKFSKVSIFSELNNLKDISFDPEYATLAGYTHEELQHYLKAEIEALKETYGAYYPDIWKAVKEWYNGYSWDGNNFVYNPFSILNVVSSGMMVDYWFSTGSPYWLIRLFQRKDYTILDFQNPSLNITALNTFDVRNLNIITLLLQTGYLTVKKWNPFRQSFQLGFPNKEVEISFSHHLLVEQIPNERHGPTVIQEKLQIALEAGDVEEVIGILKTTYANIAYTINANASDPIESKERYFHSIFFVILKLLGVPVEIEILTYNGRIDAIIKTQNIIYIIEFKVGAATTALQQIKEQQYHLPYTQSGKQIILMGIGFDLEQKNIGTYETATP